MSASDYPDDAQTLNKEIRQALTGSHSPERAENIHRALTEGYGLVRTIIGENGREGVNTTAHKRQHLRDPDMVAERWGDENFFLRAAAAGPAYNESTRELRSVEDATERGVVDEGIVGAATPIEVDPRIVDIQRREAPVLDVLTTQAQAGFTAQYNVISNRQDPLGFLSEAEAVDLSSDTPQDFTLDTRSKEMKIQVGLINVSDYSQRAEESLDYMDLRQTTLGQATIAQTLQKAKAIFYGDPSVGAADQSVEDGDSFEGLAKIAADESNVIDATNTSSGFFEDMLDVVTDVVTNTGLTWDRAHFLVSPQHYNRLYDEVTPVVRLDGYDADVEVGPQGLGINYDGATIPITPCPNIRNYGSLSGAGSNSSTGDVFLVDEMAVQIRQLAPMSTVPLARVGLSDRAALFEYYTLIDKSHGDHLRRIRYPSA